MGITFIKRLTFQCVTYCAIETDIIAPIIFWTNYQSIFSSQFPLLGIAFVVYDKVSSAALAVEKLDGKVIPDKKRNLKVSALESFKNMFHNQDKW